MATQRPPSLIALIVIIASASAAPAQTPLGSGFTYQGQLKLAGEALNDTADIEFSLWGAGSGGNMIGSVVAVNKVAIVDGLFTVELDFGVDAFNGDNRWLEIAVCIRHDCILAVRPRSNWRIPCRRSPRLGRRRAKSS